MILRRKIATKHINEFFTILTFLITLVRFIILLRFLGIAHRGPTPTNSNSDHPTTRMLNPQPNHTFILEFWFANLYEIPSKPQLKKCMVSVSIVERIRTCNSLNLSALISKEVVERALFLECNCIVNLGFLFALIRCGNGKPRAEHTYALCT